MTNAQLKKLTHWRLYDEADEGLICFRFRRKAVERLSGISQSRSKPWKPTQYDRKGNLLRLEDRYELIPDDSSIRVGFLAAPLEMPTMGIVMRFNLEAVQVCELAVPSEVLFSFPSE